MRFRVEQWESTPARQPMMEGRVPEICTHRALRARGFNRMAEVRSFLRLAEAGSCSAIWTATGGTCKVIAILSWEEWRHTIARFFVAIPNGLLDQRRVRPAQVSAWPWSSCAGDGLRRWCGYLCRGRAAEMVRLPGHAAVTGCMFRGIWRHRPRRV